jgi:hypothetical protein
MCQIDLPSHGLLKFDLKKICNIEDNLKKVCVFKVPTQEFSGIFLQFRAHTLYPKRMHKNCTYIRDKNLQYLGKGDGVGLTEKVWRLVLRLSMFVWLNIQIKNLHKCLSKKTNLGWWGGGGGLHYNYGVIKTKCYHLLLIAVLTPRTSYSQGKITCDSLLAKAITHPSLEQGNKQQ